MGIMKFSFSIFFFFCIFSAKAQDSLNNYKTYNVGIFAPLYLDSAFAGNYYKYNKTFPRFTFNGLEFINGVQIALDSILIYQANINARIFDSKSKDASSIVDDPQYSNLDLIIGSVKEDDYTALAELALKKNIPFINVTYPNDAGITKNPFLIILNSTLKAHCDAIMSLLLQENGTDNIVFATKEGPQEKRVEDYFSEFNLQDGNKLLKMQTVNIGNDINLLKQKLDSTKLNVIVGGSLDKKFAQDLASAVFSWQNTYNIKLIGMPNWDLFLTGKNYSPAYFTSPYYNPKTDNYSAMLQNAYQKKFAAQPSDLAYKGFESIYVFVKLLAKYPIDFMSHLNEYPHKVFTDFNIKPVFLNKKSAVPDYFENKHLYLLKIENGEITAVQ